MLCWNCRGLKNAFLMVNRKPFIRTCIHCQGQGMMMQDENKNWIPEQSFGPEFIIVKWDKKPKRSKEQKKLFDEIDKFL